MPQPDELSEKTAHLRDIFLDVADDKVVTEEQEESYGTLPTQEAHEPLVHIVREMRNTYDIRTSFDNKELVNLVQLFYQGHSDTSIARALDDEDRNRTVARARINLHLFRESDFDAPFNMKELQTLIDNDASMATMTTVLDASKSTVQAYVQVLTAKKEAVTVGHTFQERFQRVLTSADTARLESTRKRLFDGLDDAIDDAYPGE